MTLTKARILTVGDSGAGKSTLVYKICHRKPSDAAIGWTVGCNVDVRLYSHFVDSNNVVDVDNDDAFFVEFLDVGCNDAYEISRKIYYTGVDGVILVYDLSNKKSLVNLRKWIDELSREFSSKPDGDTGGHISKSNSTSRFRWIGGTKDGAKSPFETNKTLCGLPVLAVGNKLDLASPKDYSRSENIFGFESTMTQSLSKTLDDLEKIDSFVRYVASTNVRSSVNSLEVADMI